MFPKTRLAFIYCHFFERWKILRNSVRTYVKCDVNIISITLHYIHFGFGYFFNGSNIYSQICVRECWCASLYVYVYVV